MSQSTHDGTEHGHEQGAHAAKSNRGFASMDKSKQREIASKGGHAAHAKGTAHEFTPDEARRAGRKGGEVVSRDRQHMAAIGRAGGQRSHRNRIARSKGEPQSGEEHENVGEGTSEGGGEGER